MDKTERRVERETASQAACSHRTSRADEENVNFCIKTASCAGITCVYSYKNNSKTAYILFNLPHNLFRAEHEVKQGFVTVKKTGQVNLGVQLFQEFCQLMHVDRLDEIVIKAGCLADFPVMRLPITRQRDQHGVLRGRVGAKPAG